MTTFPRAAMAAALLILGLAPAARSQTSNALIDVEVAGHGEPQLIFIPGLATPGSVWDATVARFEGEYRCHVVTLAGFGGKPPVKTEHFLDDMADAVIAYAQEQKLVKPVIVGHSLGGVLALKIAIKAPDLPGRMVIVDSLPFVAGVMARGIEDAAGARALAESRRKEYVGQTPAQFAVSRQKFLTDLVTSPENVSALAALSSKSDPETTGQAIWEIVGGDLRPELGAIKCPVLVLGSMADKLAKGLPRDVIEVTFERQYRDLRGVRFTFFEKARHFIMVDDPDGFANALGKELLLR